jgi:predicted phosphate transport protein (TIGR00153 family)
MIFGKRKDMNYFKLLSEMADCSCRASVLLDDILRDFNNVPEKAEAVHAIEHEADKLLHKLVRDLNSAFITPIDREDLLQIASAIDSITDSIEDVTNLFDMLSIKKVEEEAFAMGELAMSICTALKEAVNEFELFRSSQKLSQYVIEVNHLEEKGDMLYRSAVKSLYKNAHMSVLDIVKWKEIYDNMERIYDSCEDVADMLEATAIKNR